MPPARAAGEEAACRNASRQPALARNHRPAGGDRYSGLLHGRGPPARSSAKRPAKATVSWSNGALRKKSDFAGFFLEPAEPLSRRRVIGPTTGCPRPPIGPSFLTPSRPKGRLFFWRWRRPKGRLFFCIDELQRMPAMASGLRSTAARSGVSIDRRVGEGGKHPPHIVLGHVERDQHQPRAADVVRPGRQPRRRMQQRLHAVDDQRPRRVFGKLDDALHAQKLVAMRRAQQVEEHLDGREWHRPVVHQREGFYARVMTVMVVIVPMRIVIVVMARVRPLRRASAARRPSSSSGS